MSEDQDKVVGAIVPAEQTVDEILAEQEADVSADVETDAPLPAGIVALPLGKLEMKHIEHGIEQVMIEAGLSTEPVARAKEPLQFPTIPQTNIPFPYDIASVHRLDNLAKGSRVVRVAGGEEIEQFGVHVYGQSLPSGDVMEHFPNGMEILYGEGDARVMLVLRATPLRAPVITVGPGLHYAAAQMWPWLVTEGHARV